MPLPSDRPTDRQTDRPRRKARHCPELLGAGPSIEELAPALSLLGEKLARVLPSTLARVAGGEPPLVRAGMPAAVTLAQITQGDGAADLAAHTLMTMAPKRLPLLATLAAAPVLRLVDIAFGGRGAVPKPLPDAFPLSAELLVGKLEEALAAALSAALGAAHPVEPRRRETSLRQLAPFAEDEPLLQLTLEVVEAGGGAEPWSLALAFPQATLAAALVVPRRRRIARGAGAGPAPVPAPDAPPFADVPLEVTALLVDMQIGFSRLANLKPGDVLPVAIARAVPVQVGGRTVATGTVGELEDRVAVQIAQSF